MTFLNPLLLLGLAAAAIPLVIHLFNFRKPQRVTFSSLQFLRELEKSTMQRVRLKQWLLLLLRTLALACLALAFARPTLTGEIGTLLGGRGSLSVAIVLDDSRSMTLRDAQGGYLDQAKDAASGIASQLEPGDELVFVTTSSPSVRTLTTRAEALEAIAGVTPQARASSLGSAAERAAAALGLAATNNRELYLVTDAQASTLSDSLGGALGEMPEGVRVRLVPIGQRAHANVAVTGVTVRSRIVEAGQPVRIAATLVNHGEEREEGYVVSAYLGETRVASSTADLAPGVPTPVELTLTPQQRGWLGGTVRTEEDAFPFDDTRHFVLNVPERRRLLVVRGEGATGDYLGLALDPNLTQGRVAFDVETIAETGLAAQNLGRYDAVVLNAPRTLSSGEVADLGQYVESGGGVLFFPSDAARAQDYDALFSALGGGRFGGIEGRVGDTGASVATFDRVDLDHPLFEGLFEQSGGRVEVERPALRAVMQYVPGGGAEQTLISLAGGRPFLQELRRGGGAAFLMASAPDIRWGDLPVRGLFVPLLYRSLFYLSSGDAESGALTLGEATDLRLAGVSESAPVVLVGPNGEEVTPEQRSAFGAMLLRLGADLEEPGLYEVYQNERLIRRLAVNAAGPESDLRALAPSEAAAQLGEVLGAPVRVLPPGTSAETMAEALTEERLGVEVWRIFLLLALAFLVAEMLVARHYKPETVAA